jgi:hypothetical protein
VTAALAAVALTGAEEVGAAVLALWPVLAATACIIAVLAVNRLLRRRTRITHLVILPPEEIGDDTLAMIREPKRCDSVTEAIEHMEREWKRKQGGNRA